MAILPFQLCPTATGAVCVVFIVHDVVELWVLDQR